MIKHDFIERIFDKRHRENRIFPQQRLWGPSLDRSNIHPHTLVDGRPADNCDEEIAYLNSNVKRSERLGKHYGRASLVKENTEHAATSRTWCTDIEDVGRTQVSQGEGGSPGIHFADNADDNEF